MPKLDEIASDPSYNSEASSASKATIFAFVATFIYMIFGSGVRSGIFGGFVFFIVGIFAVSIVISMPLFVLSKKIPKLRLLTSALDIVVTVLVTRYAYLWIFGVALAGGESQGEQLTPIQEMEPFVVRCHEPLPEFSLGEDSNPNETQVAELCACIWDNLGNWERRAAQAISEGRESDVSALNMRALPSRFGTAVKRCGGMDL